MKDDKEELDNIWTFACSQDKAADRRLHYVSSLSDISNSSRKNSVVIVDESDEIMFKDLKTFY